MAKIWIGLACAGAAFMATVVVADRASAPPSNARVETHRGATPEASTHRSTESTPPHHETIEIPIEIGRGDAEPSLDPVAKRDAALQRMKHREAELAASLEGEARDAGWSGVTEAAVRAALEDARFEGARLLDVQCRTSLCRAALSVVDEDTHDRVATSLQLTPPFATNGFIQRKSDDLGPTLVIYFARPGRRI
jgi:hypothetical protein